MSLSASLLCTGVLGWSLVRYESSWAEDSAGVGPRCPACCAVRLVRRRTTAQALAPHRPQAFKLSTDPLFIDRLRDAVGFYLDAPEKALVLCVDEKSQISGPGPVPARPADDARRPRTAQPRLHPRRHHHPLRRPGGCHRQSHRISPPPPPAHRASPLYQSCEERSAVREIASDELRRRPAITRCRPAPSC